jgi:hypothetical protein
VSSWSKPARPSAARSPYAFARQRTLAQSSKRLIESKIESLGLGHGFKVFSDKIATPGDGIIIFRGMQSYTFKAVITIIVAGFLGAIWLGAKAMLGK